MEKVSAVYTIINLITGDSYVGSSRDIKKRWAQHKCPSQWVQQPNNRLYQDMQKYGLNNFSFKILKEVELEHLKQFEQDFIERLKPTYNNYNAKGLNIGRFKEYDKNYHKSYCRTKKGREINKRALKKYFQSGKGREAHKNYDNQLCSYSGETLTLVTLAARFRKAGFEHSITKAKQYLKN